MSEMPKAEKKPRVVSYLRVSTEGQDNEKFKTDVRAFANEKGFPPVEFVEEKISSKVKWEDRKIKQLLDELSENDKIIVPELSRIGRSSFEIMSMLKIAQEKKVGVYDIKNGWELNGSLESEILAFAFSIAARIEKDILLQRTAEGRRAAMARGVRFGRPPGSFSSKLDKHREEIEALLKLGSTQAYLAKKYKCTPATMSIWLKKNKIKVKADPDAEVPKLRKTSKKP